MIYYHGSPVGGLTELKPFLSEHGNSYIYFASNPLVALLYAVKPVPKPFSFYPYGFDKDGNVIYSEYFENAFYKIYKNKKGFLYECHDFNGVENSTQINCAYTCTEPIEIDAVSDIPDLHDYYMEQVKKDLFSIKPYSEISEKEIGFVYDELNKDIDKYKLKTIPDHPMSIFIKTHFSNL